jgi:hypothetical protein
LAAASVIGHKLYKGARKAKLFSSNSKLIRFQQFIPSGDTTPYHEKVVRGFIRHPRSRVENVRKWVSRGTRAIGDIKAPKTEQGEVITGRGRSRQAEWQKPYVKRALYTGAAVAGLGAIGLYGRHLKRTSELAGNILAQRGPKGTALATMKDLSQGERFALNVTSGNWLRAIKTGLKSKFPKTTAGVQKLGGIRSELHNIKEDLYRGGNKFIEGKVGAITGAKTELSPEGETLGVKIQNPAREREIAAKLQAHADQAKSYHESVLKKVAQAKARQKYREKLEKNVKPPEEKFRSKLREVRFQTDESGYIKVKPHYRHQRGTFKEEEKPEVKKAKQSIKYGVLAGVGAGGTIGGTALGIAWKATRKSHAEIMEQKLQKRLQEIATERVIAEHLPKIHRASMLLDDLIQFKELPPQEQKRRKNELGSKSSRSADALAASSIGGGIGGIVGAVSGLPEPRKKSPSGSGPKWYDTFKNFRPGTEGDRHGDFEDYGSTLGKYHPAEDEFIGNEWKRWAHETSGSSAGAFQKGPVTKGELESRRALQKGFGKSKRIFKRGAIGAGIGAEALAAPFLLKKPYPAGGGKETEGRASGTRIGAQLGGVGGLLAGLAARNPTVSVGAALGGTIGGAFLGGRFGGAIGSRTKRRGKYAPAIKQLSAWLDDIISF